MTMTMTYELSGYNYPREKRTDNVSNLLNS